MAGAVICLCLYQAREGCTAEKEANYIRRVDLPSSQVLTTSNCSAATNVHTGEGVAIKKVTNVFSKKILAKRALREIKLLQHFRGHRNVRQLLFYS